MNVFSITCILAFIPSFLIGVIFFLKGKDRKVAILLGMTCMASSLWEIGAYKFSTTLSKETALFWMKIAHIGIILTPTFFFHFTCVWTKNYKKVLVIFVYFLAVLFLGFTFFYKDFFSIKFVFNQFYIFQCGINKNSFYLIFYVTFYWIFLLYAFFILIKYLRHTSGILRTQVRYFIIGVIVAWLGPEGMYILVFGFSIYPYSNILIGVYPLIFAYAILKHHLLDIRVVVSRAVAFFLTYPLLLGVPFFLAYKFRLALYSSLGINWWLAPTGTIAFIAMLAPVAYGHIKRKVDEALLAEQKKYQKLLRHAAGGMVTQHDLTKLSKLIVGIVKRAVRIKFAAIFLDHHREGVYRLKAIRDGGDVKQDNISFMYEYPFIDYLRAHKRPVLFEELPQNLKASLTIPQGISLIVPIFTENYLVGFVLLGEKLNRQAYNNDDIDVFKILADQVSLAIKNCIFMEESKQAQDRIFAAEKLASIGGMADGLAHQIKNRLNQFSVASGEVKYEIKSILKNHSDFIGKNPGLKKSMDYMTSISESLIKNVKKTDDIIKGILQFARVEEKETFFSHFSLKEPIDLSIELLKVKHGITEAPIEVDLGQSDEIYGVKSQITESIYNLIDNAYEATNEKKTVLHNEGKTDYKPLIKLKLTQKENLSLLEVSDNGSGIEKGNQYKIFAPFFTTKSSYKSGTGIGVYVVRRMIEENHKGKIWFESKHMEGTTFFIELPKKGKKRQP